MENRDFKEFVSDLKSNAILFLFLLAAIVLRFVMTR
jgi:hypothetical protein